MNAVGLFVSPARRYGLGGGWLIGGLSLLCLAAWVPGSAYADTGKLLLTGGVSSIDGAAGGGLTPWAVIGSNATDGETGIAANLTRVATTDYGLTTYGAVLGFHNRFELSLTHQDFAAGITGGGLGVPGLHLRQNILGVKAKVAGESVLDSASLMPQIAVGLEFKSLESSGLDATLAALGASKTGTDLYVSATKLLLAQGIVLNGTLRATQANQNGLLGFGGKLGGAHDSMQLMPEFSAAWLLNRHVALGAEYRAMPNNLQDAGRAAGLGEGLRSSDWKDLFVAWAPTKNFSLTFAYVDLGLIAPATTANRRQTGGYLSAQFAY
jgi:hypothetical protein